MAVLSIANLGLRTGQKWALWDVNLEIDFGEILGVLGRSDAGKTMLARVIAGLEEPTRGELTLSDPDNPLEFMPSVGFSTPAAAKELTVYENMDLFARLWGVPRKKRAREIGFLLELVRLADQRSARAERLSSGALRRLEIARALVADSPLTVFDGLLDALDADVLGKLWDHVLSLRRNEHKSFLILTSSGKVAEMCTRIAVLARGRMGFVGRPDDFRKLAGEDTVVIGEMINPLLRNRIQEQLSVVIKEQEGFLSFRISNGERAVTDLLAEFGSEIGCVYLKRPKLEDALDVLAGETPAIAVEAMGSRE